MASEFGMTKCFKWSVKLPTTDCPRQSPDFTVKGNKCSFKFIHAVNLFRHFSWNYYLELKLKRNGTEFKPFSGSLQVGFKKELTLIEKGKSIQVLEKPDSTFIWEIPTDELEPKIPSDYKHGNWIEFLFSFEDVVLSDLNISKKINDKSVQTPSYIDNCFLMDGLSQDFSKMLIESSSHDMEFICGDRSIKAHKSVLCCRSDVFASMLQSDMVEGRTGRVKIEDMDDTLFRQFLMCLYTGVLPPLTVDTALQFYEAGDKYNISSMKKHCADFLSDHLVSENAYDILILADRHNDPDFKKNVIDFMMKEEMPYSEEKWTNFCMENPILAIEVLNSFCQHLRPK